MMKNRFAATITKEEIQEKPLIQFEGNIHVIESELAAEEAIQELSKHRLLGFDTETKPAFKKGQKNPVALLQLSTQTDAFLFRLFKHYPSSLPSILASHEYIKIGAAINDDLAGIQNYKHFEPEGFIDIQDYVSQFNIENKGLKKLTAIVLDGRISKSQQTSNWENPKLTEAQQIYAATDAWACLKIYNTLRNIH